MVDNSLGEADYYDPKDYVGFGDTMRWALLLLIRVFVDQNVLRNQANRNKAPFATHTDHCEVKSSCEDLTQSATDFWQPRLEA